MQDEINKYKRMGYCPSVFVLKAEQYLHINKGRLHAFRKLQDFCFSIAWDWMF